MIYLAALLALGTTVAQPHQASATIIQPAPDSAEQRQALRTLMMCIAEARPQWARQMLAQPYLSASQSTLAGRALSGRDTCQQRAEVEITFRTSTLVGSLAEGYLRPLGSADLRRLSTALNNATPLNASEDFALCVAARDPASARSLALSEPGSAQELQSAEKLARHVQPCTRVEEELTVDLQSLRALVATALYRGMGVAVSASR